MSLGGVKVHGSWPGSEGGERRPIRTSGPWLRFRYWRWRWLVTTILVIVAAAASVLALLANNYRPLSYGEDWISTLAYPGLRAGQGIRSDDAFAGNGPEIYVPPQRGTFYLFASIMNVGSRAVIVEKVSLPRGSPLTLAGPVRYARPSGGGRSGIPRPNRILHNVRLGSDREILIAIPVRSRPCAQNRNSFWVAVRHFDVSYKFLFFHHVAALPWGFKDDIIIMHAPVGKKGQPGVFCAK